MYSNVNKNLVMRVNKTFWIFWVTTLISCHLDKLDNNSSTSARFTVDISDNNGNAPCNAVFTNLSNDGISFEWDFGDASPISTQANPTHLYTKSGDYIITLTIIDINGKSSTFTKAITISSITFKNLINFNEAGYVSDVIETQDHQIWIVGSAYDVNSFEFNACVLKITSQGVLNELSKYQFSKGVSVFEDINGFPIVAGDGKFGVYISYFSPPDLYLTNIFDTLNTLVGLEKIPNSDNYIFAATNNDGVCIQKSGFVNPWSKFIYSPWMLCEDIALTSDEGCVIVGTKNNNSGNNVLFLTKLNKFGSEEWTYIDDNSGAYKAVTQTTDGTYILCGGNDILRVSKIGNKLWEKNYNEGGFIEIVATPDNGFAITGGSGNIRILKYDNTGSNVWGKTYGDPVLYDEGVAIKLASDGGYLVLGRSTGGGPDAPYLIKTDNIGNIK